MEKKEGIESPMEDILKSSESSAAPAAETEEIRDQAVFPLFPKKKKKRQQFFFGKKRLLIVGNETVKRFEPEDNAEDANAEDAADSEESSCDEVRNKWDLIVETPPALLFRHLVWVALGEFGHDGDDRAYALWEFEDSHGAEGLAACYRAWRNGAELEVTLQGEDSFSISISAGTAETTSEEASETTSEGTSETSVRFKCLCLLVNQSTLTKQRIDAAKKAWNEACVG